MSLPEKIKIPPIEPGTRTAVRKCSECKATIKVSVDLFNKLLKCPSCHKGILFKRRIDEARETAGCLGGCLVLLLLPVVGVLLSTYVERPPWLYVWSPIVRSPKPEELAPDAITLAEEAAAAVAAEREAVTRQKELLEKMAPMVPQQTAQVRDQLKILQSRERELALKQEALEELLADLRQKALKPRK